MTCYGYVAFDKRGDIMGLYSYTRMNVVTTDNELYEKLKAWADGGKCLMNDWDNYYSVNTISEKSYAKNSDGTNSVSMEFSQKWQVPPEDFFIWLSDMEGTGVTAYYSSDFDDDVFEFSTKERGWVQVIHGDDETEREMVSKSGTEYKHHFTYSTVVDFHEIQALSNLSDEMMEKSSSKFKEEIMELRKNDLEFYLVYLLRGYAGNDIKWVFEETGYELHLCVPSDLDGDYVRKWLQDLYDTYMPSDPEKVVIDIDAEKYYTFYEHVGVPVAFRMTFYVPNLTPDAPIVINFSKA